jgi:RNA polymerase primary sigma factor/RNA polymerase sigma factor
MSLIRAVELFDFARGVKFSTYATWAITNNFARTLPLEDRYRRRFQPDESGVVETTAASGLSEVEQEFAQLQRKTEVEKILQRLTPREEQVIRSRFGMDSGREPQTLQQLGRTMGVSKERVRQIEMRALEKLRNAAEQERIEMA